MITQVVTLYTAKWIIGRAQRHGDDRADGIQEHFDEQLDTFETAVGDRLEGLQAHLGDQFEAFEGRFAEGYKTDMQALETDIKTEFEGIKAEFEAFEGRFAEGYKTDMQTLQADIMTEVDRIPNRVAMTFKSEKGAETRMLQAYLDKEGVDVDQAVEAAEGQFMVENPETMAALAFKKAYEADVSDAWREENPIKAGLWDAAKARFLPELQAAFMGPGGPPRLGAGNRKASSGKIYGT